MIGCCDYFVFGLRRSAYAQKISFQNLLRWFNRDESRHRIILNRVLKRTRDCFAFALIRSVIGPKNWRHVLNYSDAKLKPTTTWSLVFPHFGKIGRFYFEFLWL